MCNEKDKLSRNVQHALVIRLDADRIVHNLHPAKHAAKLFGLAHAQLQLQVKCAWFSNKGRRCSRFFVDAKLLELDHLDGKVLPNADSVQHLHIEQKGRRATIATELHSHALHRFRVRHRLGEGMGVELQIDVVVGIALRQIVIEHVLRDNNTIS